MNEIKYLKGYVIYALVATIAGFIVGAIQGAIIGGIIGATGSPAERIPVITGITGFFCGLIVAFFVFRWSIQKFITPQIIKAVEADLEANKSEMPTP